MNSRKGVPAVPGPEPAAEGSTPSPDAVRASRDRQLPPAAIHLAGDLLRRESQAEGADGAPASACRRVLLQMHRAVTPIVGPGGFEMILARAAIRASATHRRLGTLKVPEREPPSGESLEEVVASSDAREAAAVLAALVAHTLAIFGRLIGWTLALRLLHDVWPDVVAQYRSSDFDLSNPT